MKTGWVLEDMSFEGHIGFVTGSLMTRKKIIWAHVFTTRHMARESNKLPTDVVRKVEVDEQGNAVKIIPGR